MWELLSKKPTSGSKWRTLEEWFFKTPRGDEVNFTLSINMSFVVVFAMNEKGEVLVIDEYYPSIQKTVTSLVAGLIEGDTEEETVRKELLEEAGVQVDEVVPLGIHSRGKYETGMVHCFLATGAKQVQEQDLEPAEDITAYFLSIEKVKEKIRNSDFNDVSEITCVHKALDYLENK